MRTNFRSKKYLNLFNIPLFFYLTIFEINFFNKRLDANTKPPASQEDIFLYKQMGASYLCKSINDKIDFDFKKAFAVSTYTFAEVNFSKHGNLIKEAGKEKLTTERVLYIGKLRFLIAQSKYVLNKYQVRLRKNLKTP